MRYDDTTLLLLRLMSPEAAETSSAQGNLVDGLKTSWDSVKDTFRGWGSSWRLNEERVDKRSPPGRTRSRFEHRVIGALAG